MTDLVFDDGAKLKMNWGELRKTMYANVYAFGKHEIIEIKNNPDLAHITHRIPILLNNRF